jgi:hypothetical protein
MQLTGFEKSTIIKTCCLHINHHVGSINEGKYFWIIDWVLIEGIKYTKSTVINQSIIQKSFSSLLHPKWCLMHNQQVLKMVDF